MAPRKGRLLIDPLPPPDASSTPSPQPGMARIITDSDPRLPDSHPDHKKAEPILPRAPQPGKSKQPPAFDWDKRLDDKRRYERERYLKHNHPHHRLSHDIFDALMLDTAHDMSLSHRSVPVQLAPREETNNVDDDKVASPESHVVVVSHVVAVSEQEEDTNTEAETSSDPSSPLTHQSSVTSTHDDDNPHLPQQPISTCTQTSNHSSKSTKTPLQIHPVADQTIFQHPHPHNHNSISHHDHNLLPHTPSISSTSSSTHAHPSSSPSSSLKANNDPTHLAALALFICIICFFICGWQAALSWRALQRRRRVRRLLRGYGRGGRKGALEICGRVGLGVLGRYRDEDGGGEDGEGDLEMRDLGGYVDGDDEENGEEGDNEGEGKEEDGDAVPIVVVIGSDGSAFLAVPASGEEEGQAERGLQTATGMQAGTVKEEHSLMDDA